MQSGNCTHLVGSKRTHNIASSFWKNQDRIQKSTMRFLSQSFFCLVYNATLEFISIALKAIIIVKARSVFINFFLCFGRALTKHLK